MAFRNNLPSFLALILGLLLGLAGLLVTRGALRQRTRVEPRTAAAQLQLGCATNFYEDTGEFIRATGSWLEGSPFPFNRVQLTADQKTMKLRTAYAVVVGALQPPMLESELEEFEIEEWSRDRVSTKPSRCGSSGRFLQIFIDRQSAKIQQVFTGDYPARILLGSGVNQFREASETRRSR